MNAAVTLTKTAATHIEVKDYLFRDMTETPALNDDDAEFAGEDPDDPGTKNDRHDSSGDNSGDEEGPREQPDEGSDGDSGCRRSDMEGEDVDESTAPCASVPDEDM